MLQLSNTFIERPVLSLRTGGTAATAVAPIINPDNLKIEGFYCNDRLSKNKLILLTQDIRDFIPQGIVINDHDVLSEPDDLVRLERVLQINFELIGKPVETVSKKKIGKVADFAVEVSSMYIQKLYVAQSVLKSLSNGSLSVDRNQINEITDKRIIINDLEAKVPAHAGAMA